MPHAWSHGTRISYEDHGQGEPVLLFMPGWCGSRKVFDELTGRCAGAAAHAGPRPLADMDSRSSSRRISDSAN